MKPKTRKPSSTESPLLFEIDPEPLPETLTALGGVPLVVQTFRSLGAPAELLAARPKRLRFLIFNTPGRLVRHARRLVLRLATTAARLAQWLEALRLLPLRV